MRLVCKLGSHCHDFRPWREHEHEHNDTRCTQLIVGGMPCPGDGKCVSNYEVACRIGDELRRFKREREQRVGHDPGDEDGGAR